jgi:hypothetical protein
VFPDALSRLFRQLLARWQDARRRAAVEARRAQANRERFQKLRGVARPFRVPTADRLRWIGSALLTAAFLPFLFRAADDRPRMLLAATGAVAFLLRAFSVQSAALGIARRDAGRDDLGRAFLTLAAGTDGDRAASVAALLIGASLFVERAVAAIAAMPTGTGLGAAPRAPDYVRVSRYVPRFLATSAVLLPAGLGFWHIRYGVATPLAGPLDLVLVGVLTLVAYCLADAREARRLELGAAARLGWALVYLASFVTVAIFLRILNIAPLRPGLLLAAVATTIVTGPLLRAVDPVAPIRIARRVFVVAATALPLLAIGVFAGGARTETFRSGAVFLATGLCLFVGLFAEYLEAPLLPATGRLLSQIGRARDVLAAVPDPEALEKGLFALRDARFPGLPPTAGPAWLATDPARRIVVDSAGYPRTLESHLPEEVLALAATQPFGILRVEVLEALEVKRAELRAILGRFRDEDLFCVVAAVRDGLLRGALVVPRGERYAFLDVEEAIALRKMVDLFAETAARRDEKLAAAARERALVADRDGRVEAVLRLEHEAVLASRRHRLATERLARATAGTDASERAPSPAATNVRQPGFYGTAAREAAERLSRRFGAFAPAWVVAPPGVDPLPFFARAHLGSPLADGPFVVVDGGEPRDRDLARWQDPVRSPLAAAANGLLVVLDALALPPAISQLIGEAIAARRPPWDDAVPLQTVLAVATVAPPDGETQSAFAGRLLDAARAPIVLPRLRERPEDLRFLITEALARQALRVRGNVMGLDDRAFAILVEHPFHDDDVELNALVARWVRTVVGDVVRREDVLAALGNGPPPPVAPERPLPDRPAGRRRRAR